MKNQELIDKALKLYQEGYSYGKIAEELGVGKTTVYSWIKEIPEIDHEKNVRNDTEQQQNELLEYREELVNEFGSGIDINSLVALKKAELQHEYQMEKLELERERLVYERNKNGEAQIASELSKKFEEINAKMQIERMNAAQLSNSIKELTLENRKLSLKLFNTEHKMKNPDIDKSLFTEYSEIAKLYLSLENNEIDCDKVEEVLDRVEITFTKLKNWIKNNNLKKSNYPEYYYLKKINESLLEMIEEFDNTGEDYLIFDLDSEFEMELKEEILQ